MPTLKQAAFGELNRELATTRRMLSRVPEDHFDWKPHEKSMSLRALSAHIANLLNWQLVTLQKDHFDLSASGPRVPIPSTTEELLQLFDEHAEKLQQAVAATEVPTLDEPWALRNGDQVIFEQPKGAVFRTGINHIVHHRGQLSVYLRLLDVPVPLSYGPTSDEGGF